MKLLRSLSVRLIAIIALIFLCSITAIGQTPATRVTQPVDAEQLVTLRGNTHPLATPEFDQGVAPDSLPMQRILLVLQRSAEQDAALHELLEEQQTKSSPNYHMWLIPEQFGQQFGPADADIQAVRDWLTSQGFVVNRVATGRTVIEFSGTAGTVRQALHTEIHKFTVNGEEHWANASDPKIPAALQPVVAGFASLNDFPREPGIQRLGAFSRSKVTGEVHPALTNTFNGGTQYVLGPTDFATIYNVLPLWKGGIDGSGQTIAIVGESNINVDDVASFRSMFGLPAKSPQIIVDGVDPGITGAESEADLDVEWSGAVAQNATVDLVIAEPTESTAGIDLAFLYVIDNNLAPVMSESFGYCEAFLGAGGNAFEATTREQGAAQGITIVNSSGDAGSARCDQTSGAVAAQYGLAVSGLASTPYNVAVGGTDFNDDNSWSLYWSSTNNPTTQASALSYIPEMTWNDSCARTGLASDCGSAGSDTPVGIDLVAGGGGASSCVTSTASGTSITCTGGYPKPAWQTGKGVPNDGVRDLPDVSLFASNGMTGSFYAICQSDVTPAGYATCDPSSSAWYFEGAGGTSAAAPTFAAILVLVNQKTGERQGNANYVLYPLAAKSGASCTSSASMASTANTSACIFYDVVTGNNSVACQGGTPNCSSTTSGAYGLLQVNPPTNSTPAWTTTAGYDLATGLGSVNAANLVNNWTSVSFKPTTTKLASLSPTTLTHGQSATFTINVAPGSGSGTPTGAVSLIAQTGTSSTNVTGIGPFALSNGAFSGSTDMLPGGSYGVTAHYAGNGTYGASDSSPAIPVTVEKESSLTQAEIVSCDPTTGACTAGVSSASAASTIILRTQVTNASGQSCASSTSGIPVYACPTGTVTVTVNGQQPVDYGAPSSSTPGTYILNSQGYAEDQFIELSGGTDSIVASYSGDNSYKASTSPANNFTLTLAPTTMDINVQPTQTFASGQTASIQSYVYSKSNTFPLGGTVTYTLGNTTLSGTPLIFQDPTLLGYQGLQVMLSTPVTGLGTYTLTGHYSGDNHYAPATSPPLQITLTDFTATANPSSINISAPGQSGTATITVAPVNGFSGQVYIYAPTGCPTGASCTLSTSGYLNVNSTTSPTFTLTVTTTAAASTTPPSPPRTAPPSHRPLVRWPWVLAELLAVAMLISLAATSRRPVGVMLAIALLLVGIWVACGGAGGGSGGGGSNPPSGPAPQVSLTPGSLAFGQQVLGSSSQPQAVTLTNTGNASLSISAINFEGANLGDFAENNNCGSTVSAGASCNIKVTFTPQASGSRSATMAVYDNAGADAQMVAVTGQCPTQSGSMNISPYSINFNDEYVGSTSSQQSATVSNVGNTAVTILNITLTGTNPGDFAQASTCPASLAAGSNCTVNVIFKPAATGSRSAFLTFTDTAANYNAESVGLFGTGIQTSSTVTLSPGSLTFSAQNEGVTSPAQIATLTNNGSTALAISRIDTEGGDYYDFAETSNCGSSLAAGASCTISVTFLPAGVGLRTASLCVYDGPTGTSEQVASLNGTGLPPATPPGTYTVAVQTASSGDVHVVNVPVNVK